MEDFFQELARNLTNAAKKPNILNYNPNSPVHKEFHGSTKVGRILSGGNRSGKSVAGVVEGIWRSTGRHPSGTTHDIPTRGRIVTVDRDSGIKQIILPLLKQWVPPSEMVNGCWEDSYIQADRLFKFRNGSTIDLKTHQQELDSFAGVPLHWCWFDEEPPQAIFNECRLRLIDYNGVWFMTMTPVKGQEWITDRFVLVNAKNVDMYEVDIKDNPHLNKEALRLLEEDLTDDEKEVRQQGKFVPRGGVILREFKYDRHVIDGLGNEVPRHWSVYCSIDHGFNNPTAILWHAVSPDGEVVTFKEHYMRRWIIKQHVAKIQQVNREIKKVPTIYMGDPSMSQKSAETGSSPLDIYRREGIPLMQAKKDVAGGIDKMNEYFKQDKWHITRDCPNTIKEIKGYAFKIIESPKIADRSNLREEPNKKNDHCPDSCRYFYSFMPYLTPALEENAKKRSLTETNMEDFPWQVDSQLMGGLNEDDDFAFGEIR